MSMPAHPEDDLLADLAADALPIGVARQVEAHVMGCRRCADVLSGAEAVSAHLRQSPPDPMPPQVLAHLEQSFAAVRQGRQPQPMPPVGAAAYRSPGASPAPGTGPIRRRGAHTGPLPQIPDPQQPGGDRATERPAARSAERKPHPAQAAGSHTTSYTVRPLNRPESPDQAYPVGDPTTLHAPVRDVGPDPDLTQPVRKRRSRPAPAPETSGMTTLMRPIRDRDRHPGKLTRMDSTQAVRIRRQALEEQKADEPSRWPKIRPQLVAAVVLVLALAGGAVTWQTLRSNSESASSEAAAASSSETPLLVTVQMTGTAYQKADLKSQVTQLVQNTNESLAAGTAATTDSTLAAQSADGADESSDDSAADAESTQNGELLTSQDALHACLKAIGQADAQPVAVDLATYNGQEAALIVLPGTTSGYEVWVVARTCQPGDDGTIAVLEIGS